VGKETSKKKVIREFSAGGAVFKKTKKGLVWLLIKPRGHDRWQLPKGRLEKGESSSEAAEREVEEEGGVDIKVLKKIDNSQYFYVWEREKRFKIVAYFLMEFLKNKKDGHDEEIDEVKFVSFKEAFKMLTFKDDKRILFRAKELFEEGIQESLI
jgi:8-oxo-dGTP pyrophosphatase MutT (NUDIX family)